MKITKKVLACIMALMLIGSLSFAVTSSASIFDFGSWGCGNIGCGEESTAPVGTSTDAPIGTSTDAIGTATDADSNKKDSSSFLTKFINFLKKLFSILFGWTNSIC
ncbi:MAG: hypothetical protein Q4A46_09810 [Clostridia bacterium]|nr:hypothetical protein [Clostridia bacterium]